MPNNVLVLDVTGRPINVTTPFRGAVLLMTNRADLVAQDGDEVLRSSSAEFPKPLIIQTRGYVKLRPLSDGKIIKRVLFGRDDYECQYCSKPVTTKTGTVDHVKPKVAFKREGRPESDANTWDNVVTCCAKCNAKKGEKLPYECGMMPKKAPKKPTWVQTLWVGKAFHPVQAEYITQYHPKEIELNQLNISRPAGS